MRFNPPTRTAAPHPARGAKPGGETDRWSGKGGIWGSRAGTGK